MKGMFLITFLTFLTLAAYAQKRRALHNYTFGGEQVVFTDSIYPSHWVVDTIDHRTVITIDSGFRATLIITSFYVKDVQPHRLVPEIIREFGNLGSENALFDYLDMEQRMIVEQHKCYATYFYLGLELGEIRDRQVMIYAVRYKERIYSVQVIYDFRLKATEQNVIKKMITSLEPIHKDCEKRVIISR